MRRLHGWAAAFVWALGAGCASPPSSTGANGATPVAARRTGPVITQEELEGSMATNALDAIQRLRPNFLSTRGPGTINAVDEGIIVYANGIRLGGIDTLRDVPLVDIKEIRYMSAADATQRFGTGHSHGAILITRK
jgi:hypothetical protein